MPHTPESIVGVERPDFSGNWALNAARTMLGLQVLEKLEAAELRIDHSDPAFRLWRRFVLAQQEHTVSIELTADGQERLSEVGDQRRISRLTWDGATLVFTTRIRAPAGESTNTVRYMLRDAGRVLEARESYRGPPTSYDNVWVFDRR